MLGTSGSLVVAERQELFARLRIIPEDAQHGRGDRLAVDLLDTAHHHAHVPAIANRSVVVSQSTSLE